MIRTLIVEDELLARTGLRMLIDWKAYGFELLEDAVDGEEALRRIKTEKPELILLDLDIPKITGLELLTLLHDSGIDVKVIICSCDTSFDSARAALHNGVLYYLMKYGLTKGELLKALRLVTDLPDEKPGAPSPLPKKGPKGLTKLDQIPPGFEKGSVLGVSVLWTDYDEVLNLNLLSEAAMQFFSRKGLSSAAYIFEHNLIVLTQCQNLEEKQVSALHNQLELMAGTACYLGYASYNGLSKAHLVDFAHHVLSVSFFEPQDRVFRMKIPLQELETITGEDYEPLLIDLRQAVNAMQEDKITEKVTELLSSLEGRKSASVASIRQVLAAVLTIFASKASQLDGSIEEIVLKGHANHFQVLSSLPSLDKVRQWFMTFIPEFVRHYYIPQKQSESALMDEALDYIEKHIKEQVSLSAAASEIGVSSSYLSSYFKRSMGDTFVHYVTKRKLELACQMLSKGMLVREVSEELGFSDVSYFSRQFKKYMGKTPEEWR